MDISQSVIFEWLSRDHNVAIVFQETQFWFQCSSYCKMKISLVFQKLKMKSSHDVLDDPSLSAKPVVDPEVHAVEKVLTVRKKDRL